MASTIASSLLLRLINCERSDFVALNGEVIIQGNRTSIERSRYLHRNDDVYVVLFDAEGFELEFVLLDCLRNPTLNGFFPVQRFSFIMNNRIVRKTGKDGLHIVRITRLDIIVDDSR